MNRPCGVHERPMKNEVVVFVSAHRPPGVGVPRLRSPGETQLMLDTRARRRIELRRGHVRVTVPVRNRWTAEARAVALKTILLLELHLYLC
jgi:hypothetical protein